MNREIKFRQPVFDHNEKFVEWHYWGYVKNGIFTTPNIGSESFQYTGLKDENGKDIYEGDIVAKFYKSNGKPTNEVYLEEPIVYGTYDIGCNGQEYTFEIHGFHVKDEYLYSEIINGNVKVIGNIYETPELPQ